MPNERDCSTCPHAHTIEAHDAHILALENRINHIEISNAKNKTTLDTLVERVSEIKQMVWELKEKPVKRYDQIISTVMQYVITGLLAYIAIKLGLR